MPIYAALYDKQIGLDVRFSGPQGMAYIHKSVFHSHGALTSHTCLVDNRWTLKVACIVLPAFRDEGRPGDEGDKDGVADPYRALLWSAPELLRVKAQPVYGTQKGDVYSFAILAQQIAYRAQPFFTEDDCCKGNTACCKSFKLAARVIQLAARVIKRSARVMLPILRISRLLQGQSIVLQVLSISLQRYLTILFSNVYLGILSAMPRKG